MPEYIQKELPTRPSNVSEPRQPMPSVLRHARAVYRFSKTRGKVHARATTMTEPIASSSSPNTQKTQRKHKGKAKVVSPDSATVDRTTPAAHTTSHVSGPAASSDHDSIIESGDYYGDFDYDAVKADDGVELWLIRAPSTLKARNLRDLEINSSHRAGGLVGDLMRKGTAYDVWALDPVGTSGGASASASASGDQDGFGGMISSSSPSTAQVAGVGAEELNGLSVLLPCKRKGGKLYRAQKPITRHLVVSARPAKPARPEVVDEAPKREAYPDEVLTHRFRPYGDPGDLPREDHMDVDVVEVSPKEKEKSKRKGGGSETGSSKKRKAKLAAA